MSCRPMDLDGDRDRRKMEIRGQFNARVSAFIHMTLLPSSRPSCPFRTSTPKERTTRGNKGNHHMNIAPLSLPTRPD
jgi:hypothetical protein